MEFYHDVYKLRVAKVFLCCVLIATQHNIGKNEGDANFSCLRVNNSQTKAV
jgi:hypothetical protein